jgi:hypothetical protein
MNDESDFGQGYGRYAMSQFLHLLEKWKLFNLKYYMV